MAKRILVGSPFFKSVLGKDLKVMPAGPSTVIWKPGIAILKEVQRDASQQVDQMYWGREYEDL